MSVKVSSWVWEHSKTTMGHRLVALALADAANDDGRCWPGIESIAAKARVSRATVKRATAEMVAAGELVVADRGMRTNVYQFTLGSGLNLSPQLRAHGEPTIPIVGSNTLDCGLTVSPRTVREPSDQKKRQSARASRTRPDRETLTPERLEFATSLGLTRKQAEDEWAKMGDHEFASPRKNWTGTWRNWCRNAKPRYQAVGAYAGNGRPQPGRAPVPGVEETQELLKRLYG